METISVNNKYTRMQLEYYNSQGLNNNEGMDRENHRIHNNNPDYWNILVKETETDYTNKIGLDFACGCGRNIINLHKRFSRLDGVDISSNLIKLTRKNLIQNNISDDKSYLYTCNGIDLNIINDTQYDFIMSTIALQHICVYDIRKSYLNEFYRILKPDGLLSFQMGYGRKYAKINYHDNYYDATGTNSLCDVVVDNPQQIIDDLTEIGFKNITYLIREPFSDDNHTNWIYVKATK